MEKQRDICFSAGSGKARSFEAAAVLGKGLKGENKICQD